MLRDVVACVMCGVVHSGTTITLKTLREHPDLTSPVEGHILRLKIIADLKTSKKRRGVVKPGWHLSLDQLEEASNQPNLEELYRYLRSVCPIIKKNEKHKRLIDKTPSYAYHLYRCMKKAEDVPFILVKKDPRNLYYSLLKRGLHWEQFSRLYKNSYETGVAQSHKFKDRLLIVQWEDLLRHPNKITKKMCKHIGVDFDPDVYSRFFEKKLKKKYIRSYQKLKPVDLKKVEKHFKKHLVDLET